MVGKNNDSTNEWLICIYFVVRLCFGFIRDALMFFAVNEFWNLEIYKRCANKIFDV